MAPAVAAPSAADEGPRDGGGGNGLQQHGPLGADTPNDVGAETPNDVWADTPNGSHGPPNPNHHPTPNPTPNPNHGPHGPRTLSGLAGSPYFAAPEVLAWLSVGPLVPGAGEGGGPERRSGGAQGGGVGGGDSGGGGEAYSCSCDMWSVGAMVYMMLSVYLLWP
jgi:serine/threonine protein kinase